MKNAKLSWPAIITVTAALALGVFAMNPLVIGAFHDDARYLLLAKSIADGTGYRFVFVPGAPAGTHFPPAFPLVLALLWKIAPAFPASVTLFKLLNALMLPVASFAAFSFGVSRAKLPPWAAASVAIAFAGSVPILFLDGVLFSEPFFIAAMLGTLMLCERSLRGQTYEGDTWSLYGLAFAAGVAIGGVTMIRTLGIALGVGLAIVLLARRDWRSFMYSMAGIALLVVPWQLWTMRHGGELPPVLFGDYGTYGSWVGAALHTEGTGFISRVAVANIRGFGILLDLFTIGGESVAARSFVAVALLIALVVGTKQLVRTAPVSVASAATYLAVVLIWPGTPDRFLWPMWPLLLIGVARGAVEIIKWQAGTSASRALRIALLTALIVCIAQFVGFSATMYASRGWEGPARDNAKQAVAASETAALLPPGLIASEFDATVSLYTGHPAVPLLPLMAANYLRPRTTQEAAEQLSEIIDAYHPRFLLVGSSEALAAASRLAHSQNPRIKFNSVSPAGILLYTPVKP